ncbi:MAG: cysteine dioxygenase type [Actinomycetia bacterium]|jgi:mannose-6-phosphate isomerase-like protein (cupin superfamily)|nr:cysteine dioxygenase type [Actinomycetes bacterium]
MTTVTEQSTHAPLSPAQMAERAKDIAGRAEEWVHRVRLSADGRWYERLHQDSDHEVWLLSWMPGQSTGFHDHGDASGAFAVALGALEERRITIARTVSAGQARAFGPGYVHDVGNISDAPAVSVHVYSPPLSVMNRYDLDDDGRLVQLAAESAGDW